MDFNALQDTLQGPHNSNSLNSSIESRYALVSELGRGSYGVVWKARRHQGGQLFAVKQISKHRAGAKALREVMGEVETMSLLSHPNIVRLEETFLDADYLWIVMEFLPGGELQQVIKSREVQEATARRIVSQLLMAVEYIHDKGVVHRDLKPANCLVTDCEDMVVKISDFGFAVLAGADQCLSTYCGTVAFMAPEILQELNYGKPVDMWALGVMTYYMVTGEYPFSGGTAAALRRNICKGRCDLNAGRLGLFPLLRDFLAKLFVRNPHRRMTAKEALKHPWVKVGREDNADTPVHYLAPTALAIGGGHGGLVSLPAGGPPGVGRAAWHRPDGPQRLSSRARWRGAVLAVVAAHRLLYLQRCRRLAKLGFGQTRLLRDYRYCVTGCYEPGTTHLDCARVFARNPQGLTELLPMVLSCRSLTSLDLSHNNMDSLSLVQALLKMCAAHPSLQALSLAHNPIPAVAGRGLLRLARNPSSHIRSIDLADTHITDEMAAQIKTTLRERGFLPSPESSTARPATGSSLGTSGTTFSLPPTLCNGGASKASGRRHAPSMRRNISSLDNTVSAPSNVAGGAATTATTAPATTPGATVNTGERRRPLHSSRLPPLPFAAVVRRTEK